ncbi:MAG: hypothetical protein KH549_09470 [Clostridium sp.]|nr:hypothetical protein [Clostridium sp.]
MLVLETKVHETIWGGKKLTPYSNSNCEKIGHLYSINCNKNETNRILNGQYKGKTLNEYFDNNKEKYGLEEYDYFPLIIALVEANDNLSIQVHPDDQTAPILDPSIKLGKNESWFFIDAPEKGFIYDGCLCSSMDELKKNIADGNMEKITDHLPVKKGDYTYVVAGTLHAMTTGSLVYEIEENAGCTYRFYDFDRIDKDGNKRPLQIPEAFYSINLKNKSEIKKYGREPIEERRYITQHFDELKYHINESQTLQVITVLDGEFLVDGINVIKGMSIILEPGEKLVISNSVEAMLAQPKRI